MDKKIIGIDLGTTFSAVAYVDENGRPRIIPNADGKTTTPSVVLIKDGRIVVGEIALNQWIIDEEHVIRWIKRAMGDEDYRFQGLSVVEISAEILKALKADAEAHFGEQVEEAVITCPAYFNAIEIENTKHAGEMAGFNIREIIKEPTAAAVYYGIENMRDGEIILVCDLGGGTFDATILKFEEGVFIPLASMGSRELGGHDWTMNLVEMVSEQFQKSFGDDPRNDLVASQKLYEDCERVKRDFSRLTQISIPCQYQGRMEQIMVTRDEFEAKTEYRILELVMWAEEALKKAQLSWSNINRILLVGGSSRLRRMSLALEEVSGKKPVQTGEADLMVAYGAAIMAYGKMHPRRMAGGLVDAPGGGLIDVSYKRIISRSLGTRVIVFDDDKPRITNSLIIPHGTEVPESGLSVSRDDYEISSNGQEFFDVPIVEFEDEENYDVNRNYRFMCLSDANRGDRIQVIFHYDKNTIVTAEAIDMKSKKSLVSERLPFEEPNTDDIIITVKPRWVVFAIDVSYSMKEGGLLDNAKRALIENARNLLKVSSDRCNIGIVNFSSNAKIVCRPTSNLAEVENAVATMIPDGTTAMDDGINLAVELVMGAPAGINRDVVMLTDGMPDDEQSTLDAAKKAKSKGVTLFVLSIGKGMDEDYLKQLTPLNFEISSTGDMTDAINTLLTQSAKQRMGGLRVAQTGGLRDK